MAAGNPCASRNQLIAHKEVCVCARYETSTFFSSLLALFAPDSQTTAESSSVSRRRVVSEQADGFTAAVEH